jgi:hypothetical protein
MLMEGQADCFCRDHQNPGVLAVRGVAKLLDFITRSHLRGRNWKRHNKPWKQQY